MIRPERTWVVGVTIAQYNYLPTIVLLCLPFAILASLYATFLIHFGASPFERVCLQLSRQNHAHGDQDLTTPTAHIASPRYVSPAARSPQVTGTLLDFALAPPTCRAIFDEIWRPLSVKKKDLQPRKTSNFEAWFGLLI